MAVGVAPMGEAAASIAPADSQDRVGIRQAAAHPQDRLPPDPTARRLLRPAIRVPALPMRARAEMRIARQRHTAKEECLSSAIRKSRDLCQWGLRRRERVGDACLACSPIRWPVAFLRPRASAQASGSSRSTNAGATRTFVGQGHDLYEEGPRTGGTSAAARSATVGSANRTVSGSLRASSPVASTAFASRGLLAGNASFGARSFAARGIAGAAPGIAGAGRFGFGLRPVAPLFPRPGFGFGFGLRPGFGFGGLGPGFRPFGFGFGRFGLGFGFGFGWNPCWGAAWVGMIPSASADSPDLPTITTRIRPTISPTIQTRIRRSHLDPIRTTIPATKRAAQHPIHNLPSPRSL